MQCPICNGPTQPVFTKNGYEVFGCRKCGHRSIAATYSRQAVQHHFADDYFQGGQVCYLDYLEEAELLRAQGRRCGRMLSRYMRPGLVLDIGSAAGFILKGLSDCGWQGFGIEPNAGMAGFAQAQLGLNVANTTIEEFRTDQRFDLVSMFHVVPHIAEPKDLARRVSNLLAPGGHWLVEIWNRESAMQRLSGTSWHEYDPPRVLHWYSLRSLCRLADVAGFRRIAWGRPTKWLQLTKLIHRMPCGRQGHNHRQVNTSPTSRPPAWAVPYPGDDLVWALFRKP